MATKERAAAQDSAHPRRPAGPWLSPERTRLVYVNRAWTEVRSRVGFGAETPRSVALFAFPDAVTADPGPRPRRPSDMNIAADLDISQRTIDNHRAAIMSKTGSKSLPALIRAALAADRPQQC